MIVNSFMLPTGFDLSMVQAIMYAMFMTMPRLSPMFATITFVFLMDTLLNQSSSFARILGNQTPTTHYHHHHNHPNITFLMQNVLNVTHPSSKPTTTEVASSIPFPKPLGYFPPYGAIPLPESNPTIPIAGMSARTFDFSSIGVQFPGRAALKGLELGSVTGIDEHVFEATMYGESVVGKAKGIFVANSEGGTSHMVALTANFGRNELKDGLKFFGVYKKDEPESHIAVIGGVGKFDGANGYAVIKGAGEDHKTNSLLSFNVYLS